MKISALTIRNAENHSNWFFVKYDTEQNKLRGVHQGSNAKHFLLTYIKISHKQEHLLVHLSPFC